MPSSSVEKPRGAAARKSGRGRSARRRSGPAGWLRLWPLVLCLVATPFAVRGASVLALEGPKAFSLLYPWVEVLRSPALHIPGDVAGPLAQAMLYLQFPLYGLLMTLAAPADKPHRALPVGVLAHFAGLAAAVGLAYLA